MIRSSTLTGFAIAALVLAVAVFIASHGKDRPATTGGGATADITVQVQGTMPVRNRANEASVNPVQEQPKSPDPVPPLPRNVR